LLKIHSKPSICENLLQNSSPPSCLSHNSYRVGVKQTEIEDDGVNVDLAGTNLNNPILDDVVDLDNIVSYDNVDEQISSKKNLKMVIKILEMIFLED